MTLKQKLVMMGVTEHEAEVYGALLQVDTVKVLDLANMVKLPRPNIYIALHRLRKRGMVTVGKGKVSQYTAVPPGIAFRAILAADDSRRRAKVEILKELNELHARRKVGNFRPNAIEVLSSDRFAFAQVRKQAGLARHEILSIYSSATRMFSGVDAREVDSLEMALLRRRVRIRCLYNPAVLGHGLDYARVEQVVPAGEEGRVCDLLPMNLVVMDSMALFQLPDSDGKSTVYRANDPNLIQAFRFMFEYLWARSTDIREFLRNRGTGGGERQHPAASSGAYRRQRLARRRPFTGPASQGRRGSSEKNRLKSKPKPSSGT